jgi:hypothetical protein
VTNSPSRSIAMPITSLHFATKRVRNRVKMGSVSIHPVSPVSFGRSLTDMECRKSSILSKKLLVLADSAVSYENA